MFLFESFLLLFFILNITGARALSVEHVLHERLLDGYDKTILPVEKAGDAVVVGLQPEIFSLLQIDERTGTIQYMQWLKLTWKDPNLQWNPKQYENIHFTYFPAENIWRPDIAIYNQRDEIKFPFPLGGVVAEVFFDGTVLIELLQSVEITCQEFDVADFPFDTQICTTRYASWMRGNEQLILTTDFELNNEEQFNHHSEWDLLAFVPSYDQMNATYTTLLNMEETDGSEKLINRSAVFDEVHYDLKIRRKPNYYIYSLIIPSGIITTLCIIGLFAPFEDSGNREEKITLGLTTMLSMVMILMMVAESMPRSSGNRPLLGTFILFEIGLSTVATVATAVILITHNRVELVAAAPPKSLVRFTYFIFRIKNRTDRKERSDIFQPARIQPIKELNADSLEHLVVGDIEKDTEEEIKKATLTEEERQRAERFSAACEEAVDHLTYQTQKISNKKAYNSAKRKWIHIFCLVDSICMFLFNFVHLFVAIYMFL